MSDISYYVRTIPVIVVNEGLGHYHTHTHTHWLNIFNLFISDLTIPIKRLIPQYEEYMFHRCTLAHTHIQNRLNIFNLFISDRTILIRLKRSESLVHLGINLAIKAAPVKSHFVAGCFNFSLRSL